MLAQGTTPANACSCSSNRAVANFARLCVAGYTLTFCAGQQSAPISARFCMTVAKHITPLRHRLPAAKCRWGEHHLHCCCRSESACKTGNGVNAGICADVQRDRHAVDACGSDNKARPFSCVALERLTRKDMTAPQPLDGSPGRS